jgi:hypothetical protein
MCIAGVQEERTIKLYMYIYILDNKKKNE